MATINGTDVADLPTNTRSHVIITIVSTLVPFTILVVAGRFYSRHILVRKLGADDWLSMFCMVIVTVDGIMMYLMTTKGLGHHKWTLSNSELLLYYKYFYVDILLYIGALGFIKVSILLQYFRLFSIKMRSVILWLTIIVSLWSAGSWLACVFHCYPVAGFWDPSIDATCIPELPQWYANAVGNIVTDLVIFAFPIPVLWKLNVPRSQRIPLIGIFCLGFFVCCISVVRITFLSQNNDDTYENIDASGWSIGELCLGIVVSCLPTLRPILWNMWPSLRTPQNSQNSGPTFQTIGGGYVGGGANRGSKPRRGNKNQSMMSRDQGDSIERLADIDDLEMEVGMPRGQGDGKSGNASTDSIRGLEDSADVNTETLLGLRSATLTTIKASPEKKQVTPEDMTTGNAGIQIKRDVIQKSRLAGG